MDVSVSEAQIRASNPSLYKYAGLQQNPTSSAVRSNSNGSLASVDSLPGSGTRSGIKMGTLLSPGNRPIGASNQMMRPLVRPLDPATLLGEDLSSGKLSSSDRTLSKGHLVPSKDELSTSFGRMNVNDDRTAIEDTESDMTSEESEWEQEVTEAGNVNFVVPFTTREAVNMLEYKKIDQPATLQDSHSQKQQPGKNLSRMVRRRESKRDRNNVSVGGNVVLKTPSGRPQLHLLRKGSNKRSSVQESSDNDSSTYGQIKTVSCTQNHRYISGFLKMHSYHL